MDFAKVVTAVSPDGKTKVKATYKAFLLTMEDSGWKLAPADQKAVDADAAAELDEGDEE